ncbi:MAG TPA: hypothetical protein DDZ91_04535 [Firmicutes bacterium]|mgnify:FL=1|jgi:V/A-type H+-transporting ATPase subunit I|nr:hypothetical protein [Bacillota bacterium]
MAIVPMKHMELYGLVRHRSSFLSELQRLGLVELVAPAEEEISSEPGEELRNQLDQIENRLAEVNRVLAICERFAPRKPNFIEQFAGMKTVLTWEEQQNYLAEREKLEELSSELFKSENEYARMEQEKVQVEREISQLRPWIRLDLPRHEWKGSTNIQVLLGSIEGSLSVFTEALAQEEITYSYQELGAYESRLYLVFFLLRKTRAEEILKNKGFVPTVPEVPTGTVQEYLDFLVKKKTELTEKLEAVKNTIKRIAEQHQMFETFYDYWHNLKLQVEANRQLLMSKDVFALEGWVEAEKADRVKKVLEAMGLPHYVLFRAPEPDEKIPIAMKNSTIITPFETLVESFSYPRQDEVDPSSAIAPFFFLCFGIALGDAGYGMLLALICSVLLWKMTMKPNGRKMAGMLLASGLGAVFVGLLTSSIFSFSPYKGIFSFVESPQILLIVSLGLGLVQLYVGTLISAWMNIRDGRVVDAIWKQGFWLLFLTGILLTVGAPQLGWEQYALHIKYGTVIAAALLIIGNTRGKKGLLSKLMAIPGGILNIYGSVGFFSDVLSYSRLMALGLSGGVMGSIINMFVRMTWGVPVIGWLFSILIFLFGHALNMGLNVLGAYVHSSRLQYLEFFNTFFEGGGKPFTPLKIENINIFLKKEREV